MGLDSAEFRDACRMDSIEQLGLVLAKSICGAPIVGKDNLNECIQALPESPKHSCVTSASSTAEMFDFSAEGSSRLQVLLQVGLIWSGKSASLKLCSWVSLVKPATTCFSGSSSHKIQWSLYEDWWIYARGPVLSHRPSNSSYQERRRFLRGESDFQSFCGARSHTGCHCWQINLKTSPIATRPVSAFQEEELVGILHRDTAVSNLRFLNIFYGYSPHCFALAVNLLDRLLSRVKTHPRYLSCVATSCFYIAAKVMEDRRVSLDDVAVTNVREVEASELFHVSVLLFSCSFCQRPTSLWSSVNVEGPPKTCSEWRGSFWKRSSTKCNPSTRSRSCSTSVNYSHVRTPVLTTTLSSANWSPNLKCCSASSSSLSSRWAG